MVTKDSLRLFLCKFLLYGGLLGEITLCIASCIPSYVEYGIDGHIINHFRGILIWYGLFPLFYIFLAMIMWGATLFFKQWRITSKREEPAAPQKMEDESDT